MGCDIHLYVEKWNPQTERWESADTWSKNKYYDPTEDDGERPLAVAYEDSFYNNRNYRLFGMLADVRNGRRGFGGADMGNAVTPMAEPRGLPEDVCSEIENESDYWGLDGHSHSWLTLAELLNYDWTQVVQCRGYVTALEYFQNILKRPGRKGVPESFSADVFGRGVKKIPPEEMERVINGILELSRDQAPHYREQIELIKDNPQLAHLYTRLEWTETYYELASDFFGTVIPRLLALSDSKDQDDVRIVFWFDN